MFLAADSFAKLQWVIQWNSFPSAIKVLRSSIPVSKPKVASSKLAKDEFVPACR